MKVQALFKFGKPAAKPATSTKKAAPAKKAAAPAKKAAAPAKKASGGSKKGGWLGSGSGEIALEKW